MDVIKSQLCSNCQQPFHCGAQCDHCWCADYPAILPPDATKECLCPACLAKTIGTHIEDRLDTLDHDEALVLAKSFVRRRYLPVEHIDYTVENGLWVFTRWFLLKRGKCCQDHCRNCPFPKNHPE